MRITRLAFATLFTALVLSALTTASASAFHPLFLTESGLSNKFALLLFNAEGGSFLQLGLHEQIELVGISCEKTLIHGWILSKSLLARVTKLEAEGKCLQVIMFEKQSLSNGPCKEPIQFNELLGKLGLVSSTNKKVVLLLEPVRGAGEELGKSECTNGTIAVEGAVVAEFPEVNRKGVNQYNKHLTETELVLESENKSRNQKITEIFLLGTQMTKVEPRLNDIYAHKEASWEFAGSLGTDGWIEISTTQ